MSLSLSSADFKTWLSDIVFMHGFKLETNLFNSLSVFHIPEKHVVFTFIEIDQWVEVLKINEQIQSTYQKSKIVSIWEDQWMLRKDVMQSRIKSLLGLTKRIHGRATKVKRIEMPVLNEFLFANHLNVITKAKFKYGLFYKEEMVAVASFSGGRLMEHRGQDYRSYELIRFANLLNHTVVGGLSKLIKQFIEEVKPGDIVTYADSDWSSGEGYERLGFKLEGTVPAQQFWVRENEWIRYYAHKVPTEILIDKKNTEPEDSYMIRKGFHLIENSGSLKYRLVIHHD